MGTEGGGGFITGVFGSQNDWAGPNQTADASHFQYGGSPTGANDRAQQLTNLGNTFTPQDSAQVDKQRTDSDYMLSGDNRRQQAQYGDYLKSVAMGQSGPSAAQAQMQSGTDQAIRAQQAMAASSRGGGGSAALAQYNAGNQAATLQQQNVNASAQLRAHEQQQAMGLYDQNLAQQRQAGLQQQGISGQQAQYQAGLDQQQHQLAMQGKLGAEGLGNQVQLGQLNAYGNQEALKQKSYAQNADTNQANGLMGVALGASALGAMSFSDGNLKTNMQTMDGGMGGWQGFQRDPGVDKLQLDDKKSSGGGIMSMMGGMGGAGGMNAGMSMMSDAHSKERIRSLEAQNDAMKSMLGATAHPPTGARAEAMMDGDVGEAPRNVPAPAPRAARAGADRVVVAEMAPPDAAQEAAYNRSGYGIPWTVGGTHALPAGERYAAEDLANRRNMEQSVAEMGGPPAGTYPAGPSPYRAVGLGALTSPGVAPVIRSDDGAKQGKKSGAHELDAFLDHVRPVSYDYKNPERDGHGRQYGIIAQDLEKSPMGRSMVMNTPQGKMVDTRKAALGGLAALSDHHERLERLEAAFGMRPNGGK